MSFTNKFQLPNLVGQKRRRGRPPLSLNKQHQEEEELPAKEENMARLKPTPIHSAAMQTVQAQTEQPPETPNFVDPNSMPRHGFLHGYYGPSDRDMMRHDYSDLHPSFSGFGYRDHLPLS